MVDDQHGIDKVKLTIHGGEYGNRTYEWNLPNLPGGWIWDRYFGEIVAPIGDYPVTVEAIDGFGNVSTEHATIIIPAPETDTEALAALIVGDDGAGGDTQAEASSAPESSGGDGTAASGSEAAAAESETSESGSESVDQGAALNTDTSAEQSASSVSEQPQTVVAPTSEGGSSGVLWGAAALAAIAGATAYGLNRKKQREAEIEAKRKEIAERRSERSFADHLASLRQAAEARIAPVRNAIVAATAAAAAAAAEAAQRDQRAQEQLERLENNLGERETPPPSPPREPESGPQPAAATTPSEPVDSWQRIELQRTQSYAGYPPGSAGELDEGPSNLPEIPPLPTAFEGQIPSTRFTVPTSPLASTTYQVGASLTLRTLAEDGAITAQLTSMGVKFPMPRSLIGDWSIAVQDGGVTVSQSTDWLSIGSSAEGSGASAQLRWKSTWGVGQYDGEFGSRTGVELESRVLVGGGDVSHMSASVSGTNHFRPQNMLLYGAVGLAVVAVTVGVAPLAAAASAAAASLGFAFNQLSAAFGG